MVPSRVNVYTVYIPYEEKCGAFICPFISPLGLVLSHFQSEVMFTKASDKETYSLVPLFLRAIEA